MRKSYDYEVIKKISDSGKKYLGSGSGTGSGLRFLAGSGLDEYGSETLLKTLLQSDVMYGNWQPRYL